MKDMRIVVLCGGISREREVSLESGRDVTEALKKNYTVECFDIIDRSLPSNLDPRRDVAFLTSHGTFGEDGGIQELLEKGNYIYAGSNPESSRLCFNKKETKARVATAGILVADDLEAETSELPAATDVVDRLGNSVVVKPVCGGSSIGVSFAEDEEILSDLLANLESGNWLFEKKIKGREISIGVLEGEGMGLVEVLPKGGIYDYKHKYEGGMTDYRYPAEVGAAMEREIRESAVRAFDVCGCRDFIRVDFMISESDECYFLEINTLPGLTSTSLLRKSASCLGFDYPQLAQKLVAPAITRFESSGGLSS